MDHPSHEVEIPMPLNSNAYLAQSHENNTHSNEEMTHHHNSIVKKSPLLVKYRECLKNHAASIGGNATDGCGEFMPSGEEGTLEALKCSACNCHRNFHRKKIEGEIPNSSFDYFSHFKREKKYIGTSHHHNGVLIPRPTPHNMIMPLTMQQSESDEMEGYPRAPFAKKRHRTKFSSEQKEKMLAFAERAGWKLQKQEESVVQQLCQEIGVKRRVLKVWMHNNKHNYAKKTLDHEGTDNHTAITDSREGF